MAKLGVALQLYGVREEMDRDAVGTLRAVAGLGYRAVELVAYYGTYGLYNDPDLGSALLFLPALFAMLFAAGARLRHLALIVCLGVAIVPLLWVGVMSPEQPTTSQPSMSTIPPLP